MCVFECIVKLRVSKVLDKFMSRLVQNRVMPHKDLRSLSKYQIILARDQFRKNPPPNIKGPQQGMLEGDFALCISLYHGYELMMQMGLRSLFFYIQGIMDGTREMSRARNELQRTPTFVDLYHEMEAMFVKPSAGPGEPFIYSHPKLKKLDEVVLQHFKQAESLAESKGPQEVSTRVMIFSSFRESVQEIADMLNHHAPLIRVMTFMGQASAGKGVKGFTQKEQLEVMSRFRQGGFNTLVSTCVGEEGLDIGEVDLIVCFDAQKNPIRLVQRMGRTGRKRQGRIVVILAEGREDRTYNQSMSNKRSVDKSIIGNRSGFHMYPNSPRMLPEGVNPTLHKMHITCGQFDHQESNRRSVRGRRSNSEGRVSLIHPQNLIRQGSSTSDGFLSSTEYSLWAATMKLGEDEAHPTLKPSRFLSIPGDLPPQDEVSKSRPASRELSLWEWRHWQHKALPTHVVDHSLRCNHFIKVMELIDGMREEKEGECRYEQELLPYLHKANAVGHVRKGPKQKQKGSKSATKTNNVKAKPCHSTLSDLECFEEEEDWQKTRGKSILSSFAATKEKLAAEHVTEAPNDGITDHRGPEGLKLEEEEDVELQAMFYLPKWDSAIPPSFAKLLSGRDQSLKVILANVAELLSRSPPPLIEDLEAGMAAPSLPPSPQQPHQPFHDQQQSVSMGSPTWDEVFGEEEENNNHDIGHNHKETDHEIYNEKQAGEEAKKYKEIEITDDAMTEEKESCWVDERNQEMPILTHGGELDDAQMDDSMDLFGDDEDFLQMTIPEISTPGGTSTMSPVQQNSKSFDSSHDYFPVNFDLGYSLEDSDEAAEEAVPAPSMLTSPNPKEADTTASPRAVSNSSTPSYSFHRQKTPLQSSESKISTPQMLSAYRKRETASFLASPLVSRYGALPSPITSQGARRTLVSGITGPRIQSLFPSLRQTQLENSPPHTVECVSDTQSKVKPLSSPEVSKISSDVDSPLVVKRKRTAALNTSDEMEDQTVSDDDFQNVFTHRNTAHGAEREPVQQSKAKHPKCRRGRQFLDEEAKLSEEEGSDVSSDEEDGEDQNHSLEGFVVGNTHCSQGLNDSEMQGVYLKSVRSPAVHGKFKLSYKNHHNMDIFSQVPEMDETYAADSFVVGSDEEEGESSEQEADDIELMPEESYVEGRRQYATRRRVFLHKARAGAKTTPGCPPKTAGVKTKRTRVIHMNDSSDEEMEEAIRRSLATEGGVAVPLWPQAVQPEPNRQQQQKPSSSSSSSTIASKVSLLSKAKRSSVSAEQQNERHRRRLENQHLLSDELDFAESDLPVSSKKQPQVQAPPAPSSEPQTSSAQSSSVSAPPVCILVDSRCLSGGAELMTSLRQRHAATLHVCSLDGSYFIVSNRTAVEKHSQSDLAATQNRKRLAERVNSLQGLFERVCLIVEKDRSKPGEASRPFQRTRCYDSTLTALVSTGVRLLWSDGAEQSAGLLADLARLEQRKGQAIAVPLEVKGSHRQQALQLYLGLPSVSYVHALSLSHNFSSIAQLINSSIEAIQKGGSMSRSRAEEIYRFLRYSCDSFMMNSSTAGKSS
ncbi:Fanconi anemia group M protein [Dissostichus eleginoides]|uniref:Fanconi anemia group M protein n=1 Tax=Dissostichus eleginoides TaxID=100907 RepID=A0AAD9C271_DISEL|nr:Fanconi anemia group M protein [Dissostichus eleginoides]